MEVLDPLPEVGTKRIRYIFTVVLPPMDFPNDPLAQRVWLTEIVGKLQDGFKPSRIGITAVTEGTDGNDEGG